MLSDGRKCDDELDALGLLACQDYNLGKKGNWFFSFRSGFRGFHSRMASLEEHRAWVYEWHPRVDLLPGHERHIAIILFCMDSAFECAVFALNALGQARQPTGFRTVTDEAALRRISPRDVTGAGRTPPLPGWSALFPQFQRHCVDHLPLLTLVADNHDVTKHRQSGFSGGKVRSDPPPGFHERLGVPEGHPLRSLIAPMQEILVPLRPKLPMEARSSDLADWRHLEQVIGDFRRFINEAICLANSDAQATLKLPVSVLRKD